MEIVFGHQVKSIDDEYLTIASKGGRTIAAAGAVGSHIVDLIPPRKLVVLPKSRCHNNFGYAVRFLPDWLPGTSFKHLPPGTREDLAAMRYVPYNHVKENMVHFLQIILPLNLMNLQAAGTARSCYVSDLLEDTKFQDEEGVRDTAANVYSGGSR